MLSEDSNMTQNQLVHINISYYRNKKYKPFATQQVRESEVEMIRLNQPHICEYMHAYYKPLILHSVTRCIKVWKQKVKH